MKTLIIVDVQNDFVEGGSLGVDGGFVLSENIVDLLRTKDFRDQYNNIVITKDWHINPGSHFADGEPNFVNNWPVHCVANTHGSRVVSNLWDELQRHADILTIVHKGMYDDAYSGFQGTVGTYNGLDGTITWMEESLEDYFAKNNIKDVAIAGIATEHCVFATAFDARVAQLNVTVLENLVAGIDPERVKSVLTDELPRLDVQIATQKLPVIN